jgi:hypothetical protein
LHVFWFNSQDIWFVMTEGTSARRACTDADRVRLATVHRAMALVAGWLAVGDWTLISAM